jgi:hypothetical protein
MKGHKAKEADTTTDVTKNRWDTNEGHTAKEADTTDMKEDHGRQMETIEGRQGQRGGHHQRQKQRQWETNEWRQGQRGGHHQNGDPLTVNGFGKKQPQEKMIL